MQPNGIITLTTDFGLNDSYVGVMKGVIMSIVPQARIVDITHDIRPQNIAHAAYMIQTFHRFFPAGTVHLVIVDPGVGSARRAMALQTPEAVFVGPDNGIFTPVWQDAAERWGPGQCAVVELNDPRFWLAHVSSTFHGRDVFAPAAAHLARGVALAELGAPLGEIYIAEIEQPTIGRKGELIGRIIHVDHFGNCITNISLSALAQHGLELTLTVEIIDQRIPGLYQTYADAPVGALVALVGSNNHLELAVRNGSAAQTLGVGVGDTVKVHQRVHSDAGQAASATGSA
ncbi:MAG TPA: SAM-dependent chlorinase/fluorinase [Roseiflexaceae bacterium]|nr:SAM-dependent chlorinase/fluorinase [Roseiflexaceae bacterium]